MSNRSNDSRQDEIRPALYPAVRRFQLHIENIRHILSGFVPAMGQLDGVDLNPSAQGLIDSLPEEKREALTSVINESARQKVETLHKQGIEVKFGDSIDVTLPLTELQKVLGDDRHHIGAFVSLLESQSFAPRRSEILRRSLLSSAIGSFEVLVQEIGAYYFKVHPGSIESEKIFTLADLRAMNDFDEALDIAISNKVAEDFNNAGLAGWSDWFDGHGCASIARASMDFQFVNEAFQRRHVVIHNGGKVSSQYIEKTESNLSLGVMLHVDADYLSRVLDEIDVLGTLLSHLAEGTWVPGSREATAGGILQRSYELMRMGRWEAGRFLASRGESLRCSDQLKHSFKANYLACKGEIEGFDSIRDEVHAWDVSALDSRYRVVKLTYLGRFEEALEMVPMMLRSDSVTEGELRNWPVFRRLRDVEGFEAALDKATKND